jgi:hypothetical protein
LWQRSLLAFSLYFTVPRRIGDAREAGMGTAASLVASGLLALGVVACTTPANPPRVAQADTTEEASDAPTSAAPRLAAAIADAPPAAKNDAEPTPTACAGEATIKGAKTCLPPSGYVKKLCGAVYPDVALSLFGKGTPWTRLWLSGDVEAWNASGGLTTRTKLAFDEELIVLARHASTGGIVQTGSAASYDVLRWDGSCVSVQEGEITTRKPPAPKAAAVPWQRLDDGTRRALFTSAKVKASHEGMTKACGEAGDDKKPCEKAERAFAQAVAEHVRGGASLPTPARRP